MKKVVIEKPVEAVINSNQVSEERIVIGHFSYMSGLGVWHKLCKMHVCDESSYQWCGLEDSNKWNSCGNLNGFTSVYEAVGAYLEDADNEVYVFDTFEEFIEEFPALVKSKK